MKDRLKWMLVGLGVAFGLQVLVSLIFTGIAYSAKSSDTGVPEGAILILLFGLTVGAFLIGGLVVGWMNDEPRFWDAVFVATATLALNVLVLVVLPNVNKAQFMAGNLLVGVPIGRAFLFAVLALVATVVGAYIGGYFNVPSSATGDRIALVVGLVAVVGPFLLLTVGGRDPSRPDEPNLPWYFLAIVLVIVLAIIGVGFYMFTRDSHEADDISISPEHHREES
jgi:MFS family permease